MATRTVYGAFDTEGRLVHLYTSLDCANRVATSRSGHTMKPVPLMDCIAQCGEQKQVAPNSFQRCIHPDGHDVEHEFRKGAI